MNEPPNSPYLAALRSGHPIVWMMWSSGFVTFQISFTPSAQICGFLPWSPKWSIAPSVRWPGGALGEDGDLGGDVGARLEVAERLAFLAASLVAGADADDAAVLDEQPVARRLGQDHRAARLGASAM